MSEEREYIDEQTGVHMIVRSDKTEIFFTRVNDVAATKEAITRLEVLRDANTKEISLPPPFFDMSKRSDVDWSDAVGYRPSITDVRERTKE